MICELVIQLRIGTIAKKIYKAMRGNGTLSQISDEQNSETQLKMFFEAITQTEAYDNYLQKYNNKLDTKRVAGLLLSGLVMKKYVTDRNPDVVLFEGLNTLNFKNVKGVNTTYTSNENDTALKQFVNNADNVDLAILANSYSKYNKVNAKLLSKFEAQGIKIKAISNTGTIKDKNGDTQKVSFFNDIYLALEDFVPFEMKGVILPFINFAKTGVVPFSISDKEKDLNVDSDTMRRIAERLKLFRDGQLSNKPVTVTMMEGEYVVSYIEGATPIPIGKLFNTTLFEEALKNKDVYTEVEKYLKVIGESRSIEDILTQFTNTIQDIQNGKAYISPTINRVGGFERVEEGYSLEDIDTNYAPLSAVGFTMNKDKVYTDLRMFIGAVGTGYQYMTSMELESLPNKDELLANGQIIENPMYLSNFMTYSFDNNSDSTKQGRLILQEASYGVDEYTTRLQEMGAVVINDKGKEQITVNLSVGQRKLLTDIFIENTKGMAMTIFNTAKEYNGGDYTTKLKALIEGRIWLQKVFYKLNAKGNPTDIALQKDEVLANINKYFSNDVTKQDNHILKFLNIVYKDKEGNHKNNNQKLIEHFHNLIHHTDIYTNIGNNVFNLPITVGGNTDIVQTAQMYKKKYSKIKLEVRAMNKDLGTKDVDYAVLPTENYLQNINGTMNKDDNGYRGVILTGKPKQPNLTLTTTLNSTTDVNVATVSLEELQEAFNTPSTNPNIIALMQDIEDKKVKRGVKRTLEDDTLSREDKLTDIEKLLKTPICKIK